MSEVEVNIPEDTYVQLERLVEEEFLNRERAVEKLLTYGLEAYSEGAVGEETRSGFGDDAEENLWDTSDTSGV